MARVEAALLQRESFLLPVEVLGHASVMETHLLQGVSAVSEGVSE